MCCGVPLCGGDGGGYSKLRLWCFPLSYGGDVVSWMVVRYVVVLCVCVA